MTDIHQSKVTLINNRDGQERFTRYTLQSAVEMIRTGKLKSGKQLSELTELPRICFASAIKNQYGKQWKYLQRVYPAGGQQSARPQDGRGNP